MLKNLMEEKQLDFNQPLLSVRRFSSTAMTSEADEKKRIDKPVHKLPPLPFYKSELKSGPIRNPGTVPFIWEKTPGKPKDERKSCPQFPEQPLIAPRLPPGRVSNIKQDATDNVSRDKISTQSPTAGVLPSSKDVPELYITNAVKDNSSTQGKEDNCSSGSEDGDETYMDALDSLSRSESFSMACSVSGVSGLDGPNIKPSGTFSTDPQTRDFMMGRFLPAAKAMASETPHYTPKRLPVLREQPRQVNRIANGDRRRPPNQYQPNDLPPYAQELRAIESDNESDIYEGSDIMSAKFCGLFPRFCVSSSLCLLNPVPGMKMQSRFPASSVRRVRANSSSASSCSETKLEHFEDVVRAQSSHCRPQATNCNRSDIERKCQPHQIGEKCFTQKLDQPSQCGQHQGNALSPYHVKFSQSKIPEPKRFLGLPEKEMNSTERGFDIQKIKRRNFRELLANDNAEWETGSGIPVVEKTLYIDSIHTAKSTSSSSSLSDVKSFRDYIGNDAEVPEKGSEMEDALSLESFLQDIKYVSVVTEKSATRPKSLESVDSCSVSSSGRATHEEQIDTKVVSRRDGDLIQNSLVLVGSNIATEECYDSESHWSGKSCTEICHDLGIESLILTGSNISDNKINMKSQQPFRVDSEEKSSGYVDNLITLTRSKLEEHNKIDFGTLKTSKLGTEESSETHIKSLTTKVAGKGPIDLERQRIEKQNTEVSSHESFLQMTLALPSPKSPSESWLKRALPVATSRNLRSSLAARIGASSPMASPLDPKWEMIVKTSNLQQGRPHFPVEHLSTIPEA